MKSTCLAAITASVLTFAAAPSQAFNPQPDPPGRWALMSLVAAQTVRLSVLALPTLVAGRSASCKVTLNFLDNDGNKLVEASTLVLTPGKAQFVDLPGHSLRLGSAVERAQFRADVMVLHNSPSSLPCAGVAATVEVFDASGRTSVMVAHPVQVSAQP